MSAFLTRGRVLFLIGGVAGLVVLISLTLAFTPQETEPAFAAATTFMNAAGTGDEATAYALLNPAMQTWVQAHCPQGRVSACVQGYIPAEWGGLLKAVFRRAAPDGAAWDVDLIATYEQDKGYSGVCSYLRLEPNAEGIWQVAGWAGFQWCGDAQTRNMANNPAAPNRAP